MNRPDRGGEPGRPGFAGRPGLGQPDGGRREGQRPEGRPGGQPIVGRPGIERPQGRPDSDRANFVDRNFDRPRGEGRPGFDRRPDLSRRPDMDRRPDSDRRPDFDRRPDRDRRPNFVARPDVDRGRFVGNRPEFTRPDFRRGDRPAGEWWQRYGRYDRNNNFVGRNFARTGDLNRLAANINFNRGFDWQRNRGWRSDDFRRWGGYYSTRYGNFYRPGYSYGYFPWWAVMPRLGLGWGLGWTSGWPYWGWGYNGWGGYGGWGYGGPGYAMYGSSYPSYIYTYPSYSYTTVYQQAGLPVEGVPAAEATYELPPEQVARAADFLTLAQDAFRAGDYLEAVRYAQHALVDNPRDAEASLLMAQAFFAVGQYHDAAGALQMALQIAPEDQWGQVVEGFAQFYGNAADYTTQLRALEAAAREGQVDSAERFLLGYQYGFLGYPDRAVRELDAALDAQPYDPGARKLRDLFAQRAGIAAREYPPMEQAMAQAQQQPAPQQPQQPAQVLTRAEPTDEQRESASQFISMGEEAFKSGDLRTALQYWQHALIDDPSNGAVILLMAQALFAIGQFDDAAGATQMAMQMLAEDQWGSVVQNYTQLYPNVQDYTTQLRELEQASRNDPQNPALRFLLGYHYGFLGHPAEAVRQLDQALQLEPQDQGSQALRDQFAGLAGLPPGAATQ